MRWPILSSMVVFVCAIGAAGPARAEVNGLAAGQAAGLIADALTTASPAASEPRIQTLPMPRGVFLPPDVLARLDATGSD